MANKGAQEEWSTGFCGCFSDAGSCCLTFWCPCVSFGRVGEIVDQGTIGCCIHGTICCLLGVTLHLAPAIYLWIYRNKMRRTFNLEGNDCADCLLSCFCFHLSICQQYRELKARGYDLSAGWAANVHVQSGGATKAPTFEGGMNR
ncbi:hypothetical protein L6164_001533 [Bauhinia variegata]|uniref:Uncharacterized protein n=1 Tax=Bauhinia variegata TaxID=167791 RepID=A0ACB9Q9A9_BAUVA|nr:hypothetical protein L6164_001533 [Bauhinia variegata]